eukprot:2727542-Amphidinium_carterae.1
MQPPLEEREQGQHYIRGPPDMMRTQRKTSSIAEEENTYDKESTTRTSIGTSLKRKNEMDEKDAKKMSTGASTIIIINNPTIQTFNALHDAKAMPKTTSENAEGTAVQSTPSAT